MLKEGLVLLVVCDWFIVSVLSKVIASVGGEAAWSMDVKIG